MKSEKEIRETEKVRQIGEELEPVFVDDILMSLKYYVDEEQAHLKIKDSEACKTCVGRGCLYFCPVGVYSLQADGTIQVGYQSCIECGSCRIRCEKDNIEWKNPRGGFGVAYKFG
ncbi:MAG: 4Fe-4S dicluster domain-containing protein [Anaerolineaceae bacterium]|nr:4Fe-4S dicluster domain-containing protein [Anaerolineaceae bacterium]MBN2677246.1 4Fe-4S dicluster domain-containing protein [Anaerolineaceae bacterium]